MKTNKIIAATIATLIAVVVLAGMYKFNYLANQPGYDVDGNPINLEAVQFTEPVLYTSETGETITVSYDIYGDMVEVHFVELEEGVYAKAFVAYVTPGASGARYVSKDKRFTFWTKGADVMILDEDEEQLFSGVELLTDETTSVTPTSESEPGVAETEGADTTPSVPTTDDLSHEATDFAGVEWRYVAASLGDEWVEVLAGTEVVITFADGQVNGAAGCNSFFGSYTVQDQALAIGELGMTLMACEEERMFQESVFMENLAAVQSYTIEGSQLRLYFGEEVALVFTNAPKVTGAAYETCRAQDGYLLGVDSNKQCVIDGLVYFASEQEPISLQSCGTYFDGCNSSSVRDGAIVGTTRMYCEVERGVPGCS